MCLLRGHKIICYILDVYGEFMVGGVFLCRLNRQGVMGIESDYFCYDLHAICPHYPLFLLPALQRAALFCLYVPVIMAEIFCVWLIFYLYSPHYSKCIMQCICIHVVNPQIFVV